MMVSCSCCCVLDQVKSSIEQHRMAQAMKGVVNEDNPQADETEVRLRERMEEEKQKYTCTLVTLHFITRIRCNPGMLCM